MKSVVGMLRKMGIGLTVYLNDILIIAESKQLATQHSQLVPTTLDGISGFPSGFHNYVPSFTTRKNSQDTVGVPKGLHSVLTLALTPRKLASLGLLSSSFKLSLQPLFITATYKI